MNAQSIDYVQAISCLPPGGSVILTEVPWEAYELVLNALGESSTLRISYDRGKMEIMSPSQLHERFKELISRLAHVIAEVTDVELEGLGSSTYKHVELGIGVEPDACFYVHNASKIIGKELIDLRSDPPPDIVVEIDVSRDSSSKLALYARMQVPEVWRYDEVNFLMYHLTDGSYVEISASKSFPQLTSKAMTRFLKQSKTEGQSATLRSFREWLKSH